jgi:hypothetical protein
MTTSNEILQWSLILLSSRPGRSRQEKVKKLVEINYLIIMLVEIIDNKEMKLK